MGASKSDSFSEEHNQLATLFKALSHPARIAIIEYLLTVDTCICGDIVNYILNEIKDLPEFCYDITEISRPTILELSSTDYIKLLAKRIVSIIFTEGTKLPNFWRETLNKCYYSNMNELKNLILLANKKAQ